MQGKLPRYNPVSTSFKEYISDISTDSGICIPNESSVRLHEKFGFKQASHMKKIAGN
jgi:L-amino acid N-acyltransferase YncA